MTPQPADSYSDEELARRFPLGLQRSLVIDGLACVDCGEMMDSMTPAGFGPNGQVFVHAGPCPGGERQTDAEYDERDGHA